MKAFSREVVSVRVCMGTSGSLVAQGANVLAFERMLHIDLRHREAKRRRCSSYPIGEQSSRVLLLLIGSQSDFKEFDSTRSDKAKF